MNDLNAKLMELMNRSLFLKEEVRAKILANIDKLTPYEIEKIITILENGEKKEHEVIAEITETDPDFPAKLKGFINNQFKQVREEDEAKDRSKEKEEEEKLLGDL